MRQDDRGKGGGEDWLEGDSWLESPTEERVPTPRPERPGWRWRPVGAWDRRRLSIGGFLGLALLVLVAVMVALGDDESGKVAEPAPQAPPPTQTDRGTTQTAQALPERGLIRPGDRGRSVRRLQRALDQLGYESGRADGVFGRRTLRALRRFQRDAGLDPDGIAGPKTLRALNRALGER